MNSVRRRAFSFLAAITVLSISQVLAVEIRIDDMVLDIQPSQFGSMSTAFSSYRSRAWTNGVVPVAFSPEVSGSSIDFFFEQCRKWTKLAHVRCVPYAREFNYLYVAADPSRGGCYTDVGMKLGQNFMNMPGCWTAGQLTHEIGHVFGLIHEHQRSDRDLYIQVDVTKVLDDYKFAYDKFGDSIHHGPYDFMSIMHYPRNSYAKRPGDSVMTPRPGYEQYATSMGMTIWTTAHPTALDGASLAKIYGLPIPSP
jgi:hypothetical protein